MITKRGLVLGGLLLCGAGISQATAQQEVAASISRPARYVPREVRPPVAGDTMVQSIEFSDAYYTRLTIHRMGSYAMLPLFGLQYYLGNRMLDGDVTDGVRTAHKVNALAIGALFTSNTITGVWNLAESRREPEGRGRRLLHAGLMLAADAGFLYTASLAGDARVNPDDHRNAALLSIGTSTAGVLVMWLGNR